MSEFEQALKESVKELKLLDSLGLEACKKVINLWFDSLSFIERDSLKLSISRWQEWGFNFDSVKLLILLAYLTHIALNKNKLIRTSLIEVLRPLQNFRFVKDLLSLL